jgi:hypothetical protein
MQKIGVGKLVQEKRIEKILICNTPNPHPGADFSLENIDRFSASI